MATDHPVTAISDDGSRGDARPPRPGARQRQGERPVSHRALRASRHRCGQRPVSRKLGVPGIPEDTELKIVARDIEKARETGVHIHFQHVSTAISFDAIRKAKAEGLPITCETAPHYLALCDEDLLEYGTLAKMNPPSAIYRGSSGQRLPRSRMARSTCWPPIMRPTRWRRRNAASWRRPMASSGWNARTACATRCWSTGVTSPTSGSSS